MDILIKYDGETIPGSDRYLHEFNFNGTVWPMPQKWSLKKDKENQLIFNPITHLSVEFDGKSEKCEILADSFDRYEKIYKLIIDNTYQMPGHAESTPEIPQNPDFSRSILVNVQNCENYPTENMKESYNVKVNDGQIHISANAEWGAIHALGIFFYFELPLRPRLRTKFILKKYNRNNRPSTDNSRRTQK